MPIETKWDDTYNCNYYYNSDNGKTGWSIEEVQDEQLAAPEAPQQTTVCVEVCTRHCNRPDTTG
jgi:hypothetical protein